MSKRPTPETDALILSKEGFGATNYEWREHSRRLERERDEAREQRDRLADALERIADYQGRFMEEYPTSIAAEALQSLNQAAVKGGNHES